MTIESLHTGLLRTLFVEPPPDEDALAAMVLCHMYRIVLNQPILEDRPGVTEVAALTQRGAASAVAGLWASRQSDPRAHYTYWYWQYNTRTPYELLSDVPEPLLARVLALRDQIMQDPRVCDVMVEDE